MVTKSDSKRSAYLALGALTLLALIWGYNWVVMKVAVRYSDPFTFAALRNLLGAVALFLVVAARGGSLRPRFFWVTAGFGLLQTSMTGITVWALYAGSAGRTSVLTYTMPFWILLIAFVTRFLPYGVRAANSTLLQIHAELEEAAAVSGASMVRAFLSITLPLVFSGTVGTFIYIMTLVVRELPSVVLLYGPNSRVIAVQLFEMWESASFNQAAALGLMLIAFLGLLAVLMRRFQTEEH